MASDLYYWGRRITYVIAFMREARAMDKRALGDTTTPRVIVCNVRPSWERPNPWPLNVRANPNVSVRIGGVTEPRVAREVRGQEVEKYWPLLVKTWPAYERFFADTHERAIFALRRPSLGA